MILRKQIQILILPPRGWKKVLQEQRQLELQMLTLAPADGIKQMSEAWAT